jgi:hypothetical protein
MHAIAARKSSAGIGAGQHSSANGKEIGMTSIATGREAAASTKRVQIVMDRHGDTRHAFDAADAQAVALAEERFRQLTGSGFRAAALSGDGTPGELIRSFDPTVEQTLFVPQLVGG